jgi:Flp pilus assembly protein TadB
MKDFAMTVWNMPSGEFVLWALVLLGAAGVVRYLATELQISRMKSMARNNIR